MTLRMSHIRRLEVGLGCVLGGFGILACGRGHWCMCGHLAHGQYLEVSAWVGEVALYAGLLVAAVVGLRGGFRGARATGIMALVGTLMALVGFTRLELVFACPFFVVGAIHIFIATWGFVRRGSKAGSGPTGMDQEAQQGVAPQPAARSESDFSGSLPPST